MPDAEIPTEPSGEPAARLRERGWTLVRAALDPPGLALARSVARDAAAAAAVRGERSLPAPPDLHAVARAARLGDAVCATFGAAHEPMDLELVLDAPGGARRGWRQEYRCALRGDLLAPYRSCALVPLRTGGAGLLKLELARGSQRAGRLDHALRAGRAEARGPRLAVELAARRVERVELAAGDALLLHPCTLHRVLPGPDGATRAWLVVWFAAE